jgi:hypothetical protein
MREKYIFTGSWKKDDVEADSAPQVGRK